MTATQPNSPRIILQHDCFRKLQYVSDLFDTAMGQLQADLVEGTPSAKGLLATLGKLTSLYSTLVRTAAALEPKAPRSKAQPEPETPATKAPEKAAPAPQQPTTSATPTPASTPASTPAPTPKPAPAAPPVPHPASPAHRPSATQMPTAHGMPLPGR